MKKIIYFLAFVAASLFASTQVSAQYNRGGGNYNNCPPNAQQSFYYYPQSNIYYNFNTGNYVYSDRGAWVVADRLPRRFRFDRREPRFVVNHYGMDVWNDNRYHMMKYRNQRYGQPDYAYDHHDRDNDRRGDNRPW